MVKVTFLIAVMLLSLCEPTTAWFGGGGGRSSSNNGGSKGGNNKGDNGGKKGTSVDISVEAKAGISIGIRQRSVNWNGRLYTVRLDPCSFGVYDVNKDGVIVKSEMVAIFGEHTKADELFNTLDLTTGDGRIEEEEFYFMAAVTIDGCQSKV